MTASTLVNIGAAESFPVNTIRIIMAGKREIGVVRRPDGRVEAVRNWCPHKGAPICFGQLTGTAMPAESPDKLVWGREGEILRCPWHGFEFEMATGARPFVESRMRLRVYPAKIENGDIWVDLGPRTA